MKPVRIGIIGCGNVLEAYAPQCERMRARGQAEVVAVCGRESQKQRTGRLGLVEFTSREQDVVDREDIDLILILTSMPEHARLVAKALLAGKHVVVEKPFATELAEGKRLVELARLQKRHLVAAPFTTLSPTFRTMARRIQEGGIGKPCSARARYGWSGPWWNEWFYRKGGGCLFDLGVYCITSMTGLLGPVKRVSAFAGIAIPERQINGRVIRVEAEDNAQVLLDFGEACFGVITSGFTLQQYRGPALEVYGTSGVVQMLGDDWDPDGYELWENNVGAWKVFKETAPDWSWTAGLAHAVECIQTQQIPEVPPEHALHVLEVLLAAQAASRESRVVTLETIFQPKQIDLSDTREVAHLGHDRTREHIE
jgi:predicted dehydrogenase